MCIHKIVAVAIEIPENNRGQFTSKSLKKAFVQLKAPILAIANFKNICAETRNKLCIVDRQINLNMRILNSYFVLFLLINSAIVLTDLNISFPFDGSFILMP